MACRRGRVGHHQMKTRVKSVSAPAWRNRKMRHNLELPAVEFLDKKELASGEVS